MQRPRFFVACLAAVLLALGISSLSGGTTAIDPAAFSGADAKIHTRGRKFTVTNEEGRTLVRANAAEGEGLVWRDDLQFKTGTIECDLKGRNEPGASFVGLVFHGVDARTYEAVYFRPFNFGSADPEHRRHAVQYISLPNFPWQLLREQRPNDFESKADPEPKPDDWFHVRIMVGAKEVRVFIGEAAQPCLSVNRLSDRASGWLGLWVGNCSGGAFANLNVSPGAPGDTH